MQILTSDKEIVVLDKKSYVEIMEVFYEDEYYGVSVILINQNKEKILGTYEDSDTAEIVVENIFQNLDKDRININKINQLLEA